MNISKTIRFLRKDEWTMGNGQCHECCGQKPRAKWWTDKVGHRKDCMLAMALEELGQKVTWEHENHSKHRFVFEKWAKNLNQEIKKCESNR